MDKLLGYDTQFNIDNKVTLRFDYADKSEYIHVTFEDGSFNTYSTIDWYDVKESKRIKREIIKFNREIKYKQRQEKINNILNGK